MRFPAEIFAQVRDPGRPANGYPGGWVSDTTFAALVEGLPEGIEQVFQAGSRQARNLDELLKAPRCPAAERRPWRIPGRPRIVGPKCGPCEGQGEVRCNLGHDHECRNCGGKGELRGGAEEVVGQIVVDVPRDGRELVFLGRFWPLFEAAHGLCFIDHASTPAVGMIDDAGALVALALPTVRVKAVGPAQVAAAGAGR